jgi:hypothetical protein
MGGIEEWREFGVVVKISSMRCTERLIGGSCIRLAFIHESTPLKKRKIRYTHIYLLFWLSG